jgi:apolipoprotein N-acyltransferase
MILLFPIPLFLLVYLVRKKRTFFAAGFLWGFVVFALHSLWLLQLLFEKSNASFLLSFFIYLCIVLYFSLISGIWFLVTGTCAQFFNTFFKKVSIFFSFIVIYFFFINNYALWFLCNIKGYPFLNPILPLIRYKYFLVLLTVLGFGKSNIQTNIKFQKTSFKNNIMYEVMLPTGEKGAFIAPNELQPDMHGVAIYKKLKNLNLEKLSSKYKFVCVFMPETSFLSSDLEKAGWLSLWNKALPAKAHFIFGGVREEEGRCYQTVYWIHEGRIMLNYDKKHCVDFVENTNGIWKQFKWARDLFLRDKTAFCVGNKDIKHKLEITPELNLNPYICSEFFVCKDVNHLVQRHSLQVLFLNDTWFNSYFINLLNRYMEMKVFFTGESVLCVSYQDGLRYLSKSLFSDTF